MILLGLDVPPLINRIKFAERPIKQSRNGGPLNPTHRWRRRTLVLLLQRVSPARFAMPGDGADKPLKRR